MPTRYDTFAGRVKAIDFLSGRVDIANKAKDYFFLRRSELLKLAELALKRDALGSALVVFELDGKIIQSFKEHTNG